MKYLDKKNLHKLIKNYNILELEKLADETRAFLIENISKTGGHLASNLGIVELTIALHTIFDTSKDRIIWDVGHQCYTHKILTGRKEDFKNLKQYKGLSGFPKRNESSHDHFNTGHSSTSISAALGMAKARDLNKDNYRVISVIGDGAIGNGLAFEAMNNIDNTNIIVILNDNKMSISENVGAMSKLFTKMSINTVYLNTKAPVRKVLTKIPLLGKLSIKTIERIKDGFKEMIEYNGFFTELGFKYIGPVDGHNISELKKTLIKIKKYDGPIFLHILTNKGKGYKFAEENPDIYHSVSAFKIGKIINRKKDDDYSAIFGKKLVELAKFNNKIVAITAAMGNETGLSYMKDKYPNRYVDVGIAESHALTYAAGLAASGFKPFVTIYSTFLQRAYDELIHDICLQNLNVTIGIDRSGITGNDGETHHGIFDLSFLTPIPNLTIIAPSSFKMLENALEFANTYEYPLAIRYPKGKESDYQNDEKLVLGQSKLIKAGQDLTIIGVGKMMDTATKVSNILKNEFNIELIDAVFVKPLDENLILKSINKTKKLVIIEDNLRIGGYGYNVLGLISKNKLSIQTEIFAYDDVFIEQGNICDLEKANGLDVDSILNIIKKNFN